MTFDTHEAVKKLVGSGMPQDQAEAVTNLLRDTHRVDLSDLATKADLTTALKDLEQRMTIKFGGGLIVLGGFLAAIKYFG